jgi:CIC family chloride channel protein
VELQSNTDARAEDEPGGLLALAFLALLAGGVAGLICAGFRLALEEADRLRDRAVAVAHDGGFAGFVLVVGGAGLAVAVAAWLVRRFSPYASGSGIPHVEAALDRELPPAPPRLIPVKFFGGLLAIGSGLALGREGPSVQMGAVVAHIVGRISGRGWPDCRALLAAGAGAGLAVAFNAPIAGAIFVLEELVRRFDTRIAIAALGASASAILVARLFLGDMPDFQVPIAAFATTATGPFAYAPAASWPLYLGLGVLAGLLAALYNRTLLAAVALTERLARWPVELQAGVIGAAVGIIAWFAPELVGGGDPITQRVLAGGAAFALLPLFFLVRFALGAVSYAAATPGGLFAPILVLGAQLGFFCGALCRLAFPDLGIAPEAFAVVGMAAFFTGVVQAPVTGIVLVIEMTAGFTLLLPMLGACFAAMLLPNLLHSAPIYDSLRERAYRLRQGESASAVTRAAGAQGENRR